MTKCKCKCRVLLLYKTLVWSPALSVKLSYSRNGNRAWGLVSWLGSRFYDYDHVYDLFTFLAVKWSYKLVAGQELGLHPPFRHMRLSAVRCVIFLLGLHWVMSSCVVILSCGSACTALNAMPLSKSWKRLNFLQIFRHFPYGGEPTYVRHTVVIYRTCVLPQG